MKKITIIPNLLFLFSTVVMSSTPQADPSWKLYDDSQVARIDISINPMSLEWTFQHVDSDSEHCATLRFRNNWIDETVDSIGFRLRGNTSRNSAKKSFKVSFNTFIRGRDFYGVEKLNLNGEHNDPSIIRSKLNFDHFQSIGLKASRANHVRLHINDRFYGLYISVEHIDEEFVRKNFSDDSGNLWKCLYPADLKFLGSNESAYKNLNSNGRPAYELNTNEQQNDFSRLVRLITILNNIPSNVFPDSIESVIDVPNVLKYFAMNVLTGSWDDYWSLMNNYYLYHEPSTDQFHIIPYDYDNTYGIDWFNIDWTNANPYDFPKVVEGPRPLAEKLMANAQYRNLYTHFIEFIRDHVYRLNIWESQIDSLKQMITPYVLADSFRTLDYGFTADDFDNSYSACGYSNQHVRTGLKQFVNQRVNSTYSQLAYLSAKPIAYQIEYTPEHPQPYDPIQVYVSAFSKVGLSDVTIHFKKTGSLNTEIFPMTFSPVPQTKKVEESDRYIGTIPPLGAGGSGEFFIHVTDALNQSQLYPRKRSIRVIAGSMTVSDIVINEFLADNANSTPDPSGEHDDWVELYNPTTTPVLLTGRYLTDNPANPVKWRFTQASLSLNPGEFLVVWCDENSTQPGVHANFKLSKSGEYIALIDTNGTTVIDSLSFGQQKTDTSFGKYPDASVNWQFMNPTPGSSNIITHVKEEKHPAGFSLLQIYPNPFNPRTRIAYSVPEDGFVKLTVFNLLGEEVALLVNDYQAMGKYSVEFHGGSLSSGLFICTLQVNNFHETIKMLLMK